MPLNQHSYKKSEILINLNIYLFHLPLWHFIFRGTSATNGLQCLVCIERGRGGILTLIYNVLFLISLAQSGTKQVQPGTQKGQHWMKKGTAMDKTGTARDKTGTGAWLNKRQVAGKYY